MDMPVRKWSHTGNGIDMAPTQKISTAIMRYGSEIRSETKFHRF